MTASKSAELWIRELQLQAHPEGGYFAETYRATESFSQGLPERFNCSPSGRNLSTAIYFLLKSGQFSHLHRLKADEVWHFYAGSALTLHLFHEAQYQAIALNAQGNFQAVVPAGVWFGASVNEAEAYTLVGCTMAPGFDFADFELLQENQSLIQRFPQHKALIQQLTLAAQDA